MAAALTDTSGSLPLPFIDESRAARAPPPPLSVAEVAPAPRQNPARKQIALPPAPHGGGKFERKLRFSNFHITINTNVRPTEHEESVEHSERLEDAVRGLLSHAGLQRIITFHVPGDVYGSKTIRKVTAKFAVELGTQPKGRRVHAHVVLMLQHLSFIRLNLPEIAALVREATGVPRPYVHVEVIRGGCNAIAYLHKQRDAPLKELPDAEQCV